MKTFMKIFGATVIYIGTYILMTMAIAMGVLFTVIRTVRFGFLKFVRFVLKATRPSEYTVRAWDNVMTNIAYKDIEQASDMYQLGFYDIAKRS